MRSPDGPIIMRWLEINLPRGPLLTASSLDVPFPECSCPAFSGKSPSLTKRFVVMALAPAPILSAGIGPMGFEAETDAR